MTRTALIALVVSAWLCPTATLRAEDVNAVDFNRDIRPIFANYCVKCHGRDEANRQAGLRLDEKDGAFGTTDSGLTAIVPRRSAESELYRRITSADPDERMPPPESGKTLTDPQIELIRRWIDEGAEWPMHWAYQTPQRPPLPKVMRRDWPVNAIDYFTLAVMEREGLSPSSPADKERLIRRVTLSLTGLPPTLDEIDAFLADDSPDAYERFVERLLNSPRYGERMAVDWLDLARYADTNGYHTDNERHMWRWRDWVIEALNRNMPFDQFTIEQLAGDLLPNPTLDQLIASGFNRNHMINFEGGAIDEEYRNEYVADRVITTTTVWLGQTMICARCHDHKYDPFTQREFYQLYAYFNNLPESGIDGRAGNAEPLIKAPTFFQREELDRWDSEIATVRKQLDERALAAAEDQREWERKLLAGTAKFAEPPSDVLVYYPLDEESGTDVRDAGKLARHGDVKGNAIWLDGRFGRSLLFDGETYVDLGDTAAIERDEAFSIGAWLKPTTSDRMSVLARTTDDKSQRGYELSLDKRRVHFQLVHDNEYSAIRVATKQPIEAFRWQHVMVTYDGSSKAAGVTLYINGTLQEVEVLQDKLDGSVKNTQPLQLGRSTQSGGFRGMIDDVRIYPRQLSETEVALLAGSDPIRQIAAMPNDKRTTEQQESLRKYYLEQHDEQFRQLNAQLNQLLSARREFEKLVPTTMVMHEMETPRETFVLARGHYLNKAEQVEPGTPAVLPSLPSDAPPNRLGLARWLVDPSHPLTARVTVNRMWQRHFGTGLVATSEDFGTRGEPPSHPELLDWLATEFVRSGWDVKHIHRLIVTSATYRQSSKIADSGLRIADSDTNDSRSNISNPQSAICNLQSADPQNRLLSRGPRFRLQAEFIRDQALAVSGLLHERLGVRSVFPYHPPGLWEEVSYNPQEYTAQVYSQSHGKDLYRRSMYTFWKRAVPPPAMVAFDAPDREVCTVRRTRTNTPLAALVLMNDPTYVEAARGLAERMMTEAGPSAEQRITYGFRLATARRPTDAEVEVFLDTYEEQLAEFQQGNGAAMQLLNVGESRYDDSLDVSEFATWTIIASMILNLSETITQG